MKSSPSEEDGDQNDSPGAPEDQRGVFQSQPQSQPQRKDNSHLINTAVSVGRNVQTAPTGNLSLPIGLEAVLEEDEESSVYSPNITDDEADEEDEEMGGVGEESSRSHYNQQQQDSPSSPRKQLSGRKTISRASSRKSRSSRQESTGSKNAGGQSSDSESDLDDIRGRENRSDLDLLSMDVTDDKGWDTDLEDQEEAPVYDHSGKSTYVEACKKFGVVPASYFLRHMNDTHLSMKHHGLAAEGMKPVAASLVSNATINTLDISDNWLGREGGEALCDMLRENCFISDLNVSDNNLFYCAERLCKIIETNDTLRQVNISGNGFDDTCAGYLADLIMNTSKLESLNISHNNLGEKSGFMLGPAISENSCLKELDLSWNHLRRKGALAVAAGVRSNVYMKKINLAWNGFGLEGSFALMDALKINNVLEELDISNNRITTEGAVLIGKGINVNETLKVLKIGKNPMQSAGCWAITNALLKNPNSILHTLDFSDILVNKDFKELWAKVEEQFPSLKMSHGGTEPPLKPKKRVHPMVKLTSYISSHNLRMVDFFNQFDKDGSMSVTHDEFKEGIAETGINLTEAEVDMLVMELDADGDGEINYSELVIGHSDYQENEKRNGTATTLRPMTS